MSTLYLIRHGQTDANEKHLYCGKTDLPLSEAGIRELSKLSYSIQNAVFLTSGLRRTEQTLELLFGNVPHRQDVRFREMDFGYFEMHSYEQLRDDPRYQAWLSGDNEANPTPGGESGRQMQARVLDGLSDLQQSAQDTVLITHGGVIAAIMSHLFPEERKNRYQWQPKPGTGYAVFQGRYRQIP